MRINWILSRSNLGGGTKIVRQLAEQMERRGHESTLTHLRPRRPWPAPWRVQRFGRRLALEWSVLGKQRHHLEGTSLRTVEVQGDLVLARDVPDADVCVATWWETMEWIRDWPSAKGKHVYYIQHHELHGGAEERVRATYKAPALQVVISNWLAEVMRNEYSNPSAIVVRNGLDFDQFNAPERPKGEVPCVGVMYSTKVWKRLDVAFEAIRRVQADLPSLRVISFGQSAPTSAARPPRNLDFVVRPPQDQIRSLYQQADAWLLSSDLEGFGMPGLEAAACRCPVVATRCGGAEEYVRDGLTGRLTPPGDPIAMADALAGILKAAPAEWKKMSDASYALARSFTWEESARTFESALERYIAT